VNCDELVELVTAYLDGALDPRTEARLEEHLTECDGCSRYVEQIRVTVRGLHDLEPGVLDEQAKASLLAVFRSAPR
jgi:anti-sigma factor RsiW